MGKLFGTDGIRGEANRYPMDTRSLFPVGQAITHLLRKPNHRTRVIIGKDTRLSGYMLESSLMAGITLDGRRRLSGRRAADPGDRVHDPEHAGRRGHRHLGLAQPLPGQRDQDFRRQRLSSSPTSRRSGIEELILGRQAAADACRRRATWAGPSAWTTCTGATSSS